MSRGIRPWKQADLSSLVAHANNPNVWRNLRDLFPYPYTDVDGLAWLRRVAAQNPVTDFAIECDGQAVGGVGIAPRKDIERVSAELGYWVGEAYWGRGLGSLAVQEITTYAFSSLQLNRVFALVFARNQQSVHVLEKARFRREGVLVGAAIKNGIIEDQLLYAITRHEWPLL